jgi:tetratricopeptide (TPR) repeat protein
VSQETVFAVAKKYYQWSYPRMGPDAVTDEFRRIIDRDPAFDGRAADGKRAARLSFDTAVLGTYGAADLAAAVACAVFDMAPKEVWAAQNLGCAVAMFCDNSKDADILAKRSEIYADAETALLYAIQLSFENGKISKKGLGPLAALGNLYLDMGRNEEARDMFETAMRIDPGYRPALNGMTAYCRAAGKHQMIAGLSAMAKRNPTTTEKATGKIAKNAEDVLVSRDRDRGTEEENEKYMDELDRVEAVTYADIFGELDPQNAEKMRERTKALNDKMRITVPDISILTQYTDVNEENYKHIESAVAAVGTEIEHLIKYSKRYAMGSIGTQADFFEKIGVTAKVSGLSFPDFLRDAVRDPNKYENNVRVSQDLAGDMMNKISAHMSGVMSNLGKAMGGMAGGGFDLDASFSVFKDAADPLVAVLGLNPFDYANMWDVFIQQQNARMLIEKIGALFGYMTMVTSRMVSESAEISQLFNKTYLEIETNYGRESFELSKEYQRNYDAAKAANASEERLRALSIRFQLDSHKLHLTYYPQYLIRTRPYFRQAAQAAAVAYKKLERYVPRMYHAAMKHLVYISDDKVRQQKDDELVGTIAGALKTAIGVVIMAYSMWRIKEIQLCGCDEEELKSKEAELTALEKKIGNEKIEKQKAAMNAFKNGEIDQNSSFYKDYIKKYEYELDLFIFKYRTNEHFTAKDLNIWSPFGSFDHSVFRNHISGQKNVSCDISLNLDAGAVAGEAKFGYSYTEDKNGRIHPANFDVRAGLSASGGKGPLSATVGVEASLQRGTQVYGKVELTGNSYIDSMKEMSFGDAGKWMRTETPTKQLWDGKFVISEKN